ncbi:putative HTLV-1-related endogenous sequence [Melopsittacus undulatus]|uniref:putative HTLV-1-related endogenous sequence n=1 Tax=Melopsittacus undulatus TaxID=13146 RepID=UPI00146A67D8|nr:putative HTLV-1-related endogenous sequence [Melopsittacus undulatus]
MGLRAPSLRLQPRVQPDTTGPAGDWPPRERGEIPPFLAPIHPVPLPPRREPPPPPTRVSNATHRAAPCGGSGGWDVRGGDTGHWRLCRVNFDEKRRCRRDSKAVERPPGCGRERVYAPLRAPHTARQPLLAELLPRAAVPPRSVVHGRGPGREGGRAQVFSQLQDSLRSAQLRASAAGLGSWDCAEKALWKRVDVRGLGLCKRSGGERGGGGNPLS